MLQPFRFHQESWALKKETLWFISAIGGGAYLRGFTLCKRLEFPPSTIEEITTISVL